MSHGIRFSGLNVHGLNGSTPVKVKQYDTSIWLEVKGESLAVQLAFFAETVEPDKRAQLLALENFFEKCMDAVLKARQELESTVPAEVKPKTDEIVNMVKLAGEALGFPPAAGTEVRP